MPPQRERDSARHPRGPLVVGGAQAGQRPGAQALEEADDLVVAAISWYELAWLARHERIVVNVPIRSWLQGLASQLRTIGITPAIADTAVALPSPFPKIPPIG